MAIGERNVGNQGQKKTRTSAGRTGKRLHRWNCSRGASATLLRANQLPDKAARTKSCNFFIEKEFWQAASGEDQELTESSVNLAMVRFHKSWLVCY